jgi:hypothetical protein
VLDLQHDRVWRHSAPSRDSYTQIHAITSGTLLLPTLGTEISLAGLF